MPPLTYRSYCDPSLVWNVLLCRVLNVRRWWSVIDDGVLLGAMPFESDLPDLMRAGVRGVVNTCREHKGPADAYREAGMEQLHLPGVDFRTAALPDVRRGVSFIERYRRSGGVVYVHCQAGQRRAAVLVLCWLIAAQGLAPREAQQWLRARRPQVDRHLCDREVVRQFFAELELPAAAYPIVPIAEPPAMDLVPI